ncbi:MAG: hypothetical protein IPI91_09745 [Flavobacteriales bacterium]|nr:hypothetical protein [Flavobacteriales bacterium]
MINGSKDIFYWMLPHARHCFTRLSNTPGVNEVQPMQYDSASYTYLSEGDGIRNRFLVKYDSAVSQIDTTIHYRYFTIEERLTDLKRSILEQDVSAKHNRYAQLQFSGNKYWFYYRADR